MTHGATHPSLQTLSDDHHRALVLARRLRNAPRDCRRSDVGGRDMKLLIQRFDPSRGDALGEREQRDEIIAGPDWSVFGAPNHIQDEIDPSLAFRSSCRMEICGRRLRQRGRCKR